MITNFKIFENNVWKKGDIVISLKNKYGAIGQKLKEGEKYQVMKVDKIKNKIAGFDENSLGNVFHAVRWCVNHGMYQNAYSILLEGCISIALDAVGEQWKPDGVNRKLIKKMRKIPTAVAGKRIGSIKKIEGDASEFPEICEKIDNILTDETALVFCNLNDYRNSYMHCGTGNRIPSNLLKEIYGFVDKMEKWFNDLEENRVEKESIIN